VYLVVPPGGCFPETRRIELGPAALTIGRGAGCAIRVDVPGVDDEHAKLSEVALIALGPDCAIGDVPLDAGARRLVMPGDEIQIGSVVVALEGDDPSLDQPATATELAGLARTVRMDGAPLIGPRVRVVEGPNFGDELLLSEEGREYCIGRGAGCDLVLEDREVSREHVKVRRQGYVVFLKDLSSTRGSWLGRATVYTGATVEWSRPRMLRLGATVLSLEVPAAIRNAAPGPLPSAPATASPRPRPNPGGVPVATPSSPPARGSAPPLAGSRPPWGNLQENGAAPLSFGVSPPPTFLPAMGGSAPPPNADWAKGPPMAGLPPLQPAAGMAPMAGLGPLPKPSGSRTAWKKSGPTLGRGAGLLLLAVAGLVVLGGLFVVFALLE
jgi:pSer/pThr/pTyr-binding forkhead associated (FHA) protein